MIVESRGAVSVAKSRSVVDRSLGSELIRALEDAWAVIRCEHPELPTALIVTGDGRRSDQTLLWGRFAAGRWRVGGVGEAVCEVFVSRECLEQGPRRVLATLLHEAAHAVAHQRAVADTFGVRHNRRFKAISEELGLEVAYGERIGWSLTTLRHDTADRYASVLGELEATLGVYRPTPPVERPKRYRATPVALVVGALLASPAFGLIDDQFNHGRTEPVETHRVTQRAPDTPQRLLELGAITRAEARQEPAGKVLRNDASCVYGIDTSYQHAGQLCEPASGPSAG